MHQWGRHSSVLAVHVYDTIMENQTPSTTVRLEAEPDRLSVGYGWRCDACGTGTVVGGGVCKCEWGDRRVSCNFLNCTITGLLWRWCSMVLSLFCWEILRVLLDWRWRSTHSGLLMRKARGTQKFSRHYSLTFVRLAGDAAARRSCSHGVCTRVRLLRAPLADGE